MPWDWASDKSVDRDAGHARSVYHSRDTRRASKKGIPAFAGLLEVDLTGQLSNLSGDVHTLLLNL